MIDYKRKKKELWYTTRKWDHIRQTKTERGNEPFYIYKKEKKKWIIVIIIIIVCYFLFCLFVALFYITEQAHSPTGSAKGSGLRFPQTDGTIISGFVWQWSINLYITRIEIHCYQLLLLCCSNNNSRTYDRLASETGIRGISSCSFNLSLSSRIFRSLASDTVCRTIVVLFCYVRFIIVVVVCYKKQQNKKKKEERRKK